MSIVRAQYNAEFVGHVYHVLGNFRARSETLNCRLVQLAAWLFFYAAVISLNCSVLCKEELASAVIPECEYETHVHKVLTK